MTRRRQRQSAPRAASGTGTLFVVATPIGNLEDITLRALRVLREADVVAAEDTRRSGNLLRHYEISTPLLSLHEHNERERIPQILDRLGAGESVALVSDAGTPGISDPGAEVVRAARAAGFGVVPVPGPSAVAAIMSVAGTLASPVTFLGFVPFRSKARTRWVEAVAELPSHAVVCFESPHRLRQTLAELGQILGDRPILIGRELTKIHEEWRQGTAEELLGYFAVPQGEFLMLIAPVSIPQATRVQPSDEEVYDIFGQLIETKTMSRREAVKSIAERYQVSAKAVYEAIERGKNLVNRPT